MFSVGIFDLKKRLRNPMDGRNWGCRPISEHQIRDTADLILNNYLNVEERSWNTVKNEMSEEEAVNFHINRIASLYCKLKSQPLDPIDINLRVSGPHAITAEIYDGQHRFAAAMLGSMESMCVRFHILPQDGALEKILLTFPSAVFVG
ncbi:hypothetical protein [Burkholderia cenocepacia]|uniref:hypothetical protein n=1 Tax=Burkholderia cenocepacia TaxID=95486 RepID=UPI002AB66314|nr:hypothetical protein [Burkholderia cenocepacia]